MLQTWSCTGSARHQAGPYRTFAESCGLGPLFEDLNDGLSSLLHREDHWDPHPRVWHRDSHDGHCGHGLGPPSHPQSAAHSRPHCELPPQRQWEHIGRCPLASTIKPAMLYLSAPHTPIPCRTWCPSSVPSHWGHWGNGGEGAAVVLHGWFLDFGQFFPVPVKVV